MFERLVERIFPTRASTQTWMILTLLLVVGIAVAAVGLYITFVLRSEVQIAYQQTMLQEANRVVSIVEDETIDRADLRSQRVKLIASRNDCLLVRNRDTCTDELKSCHPRGRGDHATGLNVKANQLCIHRETR